MSGEIEMTKNHEMKLYKGPFNAIERGNKFFELRLYDDKRQKVKVGDTITFYCKEADKSISVIVDNIVVRDNFKILLEELGLQKCGFADNADLNAATKRMEEYYPPEKQAEYKVVAFGIKVIN